MKPVSYFYDHPSSGEGHFPQKFCTLFATAVRVIFKVLFRYRVYGLENLKGLPEGSGAIIVGNHSSYLDPVFVIAALRPRPIRYISKEEFFNFNPLIGRLAAWVGAFPVRRNSGDMSAIKRAVRMLKRGELVGIFPEGTRVRSKDQEVTYHEGISLISQLANVPVIPVRLWGPDRICPKGARLFRLPKVTLRFGEPLSVHEERFAVLSKEERLTAFTAEAMARVYDLEFPR
ncbi:MAG: 1-acyl-sn-glycerol-3-phosphate acyltransferase [Coriobacteriales bacterium]|jgi:1-acyl-sn-glycerol-3-phosphate acyltransferase|nr:1-acyl-sn-glycerol-3-phosphate acyltransferase [Coriobacteriales bacterium]